MVLLRPLSVPSASTTARSRVARPQMISADTLLRLPAVALDIPGVEILDNARVLVRVRHQSRVPRDAEFTELLASQVERFWVVVVYFLNRPKNRLFDVRVVLVANVGQPLKVARHSARQHVSYFLQDVH